MRAPSCNRASAAAPPKPLFGLARVRRDLGVIVLGQRPARARHLIGEGGGRRCPAVERIDVATIVPPSPLKKAWSPGSNSALLAASTELGEQAGGKRRPAQLQAESCEADEGRWVGSFQGLRQPATAPCSAASAAGWVIGAPRRMEAGGVDRPRSGRRRCARAEAARGGGAPAMTINAWGRPARCSAAIAGGDGRSSRRRRTAAARAEAVGKVAQISKQAGIGLRLVPVGSARARCSAASARGDGRARRSKPRTATSSAPSGVFFFFFFFFFFWGGLAAGGEAKATGADRRRRGGGRLTAAGEGGGENGGSGRGWRKTGKTCGVGSTREAEPQPQATRSGWWPGPAYLGRST